MTLPKPLWYRRVRLNTISYMRRYGKALKPLFAAAMFTLLVFLPLFGGSVDRWLHEEVLRLSYSFRGAIPPPKGIAIITLDSQSKMILNLPPLRLWPRDVVGRIVQRVQESNPAIIFVDLIFAAKGFSPEEDAALIDALQRSNVYIATGKNPKPDAALTDEYVENLDPLPSIAMAAKGVIPATIWTSRSQGMGVSFISAARGSDANRIPLLRLFPKSGIQWRSPPGLYDRINYYGPPGTITRIPASKVLLEPENVLKALSGRAVFIGLATSPDSPDSFSGSILEPNFSPTDAFDVPVSSTPMNGIEIHATIYSNLLNQEWIKASFSRTELVSVLCLFSIVAIWIVLLLPPGYQVVVVPSLASAWFILHTTALSRQLLLPGELVVIIVVPVSCLLYGSLGRLIRMTSRRSSSQR